MDPCFNPRAQAKNPSEIRNILYGEQPAVDAVRPKVGSGASAVSMIVGHDPPLSLEARRLGADRGLLEA